MSETAVNQQNTWYTEVRHEGILVSPVVLQEYLPSGPESIDNKKIELLRDSYTKFKNAGAEGIYEWLDILFESVMGLDTTWWLKETRIPSKYKITKSYGGGKETLVANRLFRDCGPGIDNEPRYLVKIDTENKKLGIGKGRTVYSKFVELLRLSEQQIGLLTNGIQFRLIYAGLDYETWIEWDADRWFEDTTGQLFTSFSTICGLKFNTGKLENKWPLLHLVLESRKKQGDLSTVLGEQIRLAIEELIESIDLSSQINPDLLKIIDIDPNTSQLISEKERLDAIYQASIRVLMRLVISLYAEARELLPKSLEIYDSSYSIEGIYRILEEAQRNEGEEALETNFYAWQRLQTFFRLVFEGSAIPDIPVTNYGGNLFRRGDPKSSDPVLRALSIFEDPRWEINDHTVLNILRQLKTGEARIYLGKGKLSGPLKIPVDFSGFDTEYIGIMYEGLLDYQLKKVSKEEEAVIFLNIGQEPVLPLNLLEKLDKEENKRLYKKLIEESSKKIKIIDDDDDNEDEEDDIEIENTEDSNLINELTIEEEIGDNSELEAISSNDTYKQRANVWVVKFLESANLLKVSKKNKSNSEKYNKEVMRKVNLLTDNFVTRF